MFLNDFFLLECLGFGFYEGGRFDLNLKSSWIINGEEVKGGYFM